MRARHRGLVRFQEHDGWEGRGLLGCPLLGDLRPLAVPSAAGLCRPALGGSLTCLLAAAPAALTSNRRSRGPGSHRRCLTSGSWQSLPAALLAPPELTPQPPPARDLIQGQESVQQSWAAAGSLRRREGRSAEQSSEPVGLLLRRYAGGTFPRGRVKALGPGPRLLCDAAGRTGTPGRKPQEEEERGRGTACPEAKPGSPAPCHQPPIAQRPSEQTWGRTRIQKRGSCK